MKKQLNVLISGGGTGGHIFPALSIANGIKERRPDANILFVGAENRMEMEKVPAAGYKIVGLPVSGFSFAESGMMMPPTVFSTASAASIRTLSDNGLICIILFCFKFIFAFVVHFSLSHILCQCGQLDILSYVIDTRSCILNYAI